MKLLHFPVNAAWAYVVGTPPRPFSITGFPLFFPTRAEAVEAARFRGLKVDRRGNVEVAAAAAPAPNVHFTTKFQSRRPRIRITYTIITSQSAEDGDYHEMGFINEDGVPMESYDGHTVVDAAVRFLTDEGGTEPSSSTFNPRVWYATESMVDMYTGEVEERAFHLVDFTTSQLREIFERVTGMSAGGVGDLDGVGDLGDWKTRREFSPLAITNEQLRQARGNKASAIIWMYPEDFLALTTSRDDADWAQMVAGRPVQPLEKYNRYSREGETRIMPMLDVEMSTGQVMGHEGRHRAAAVMNSEGPEATLAVAIVLLENGYAQYYREDGPPNYTKTFMGFADVPRVLLPQHFSYRDRNGRMNDVSRFNSVTLTDAAFAEGLEPWREASEVRWE